MDSHFTVASKEDIWRLQSDMKSVYAVQAEHADRLLRLERRLDDDNRTKSVWGSTPSFPGVRGGTPHQDNGYNPAAEAFKNFDQDNSTSLLGSLHIDADDEPRRGASRANSVRFDESALHGQLSHTSRSSSEFFPMRTGSAFGSHPLTERSSSHKSEGRQSSTGLSTHSAGLNGLGFDQRTQETLVDLHPRPAAGLLILGPHPSIIRCWLGNRFSNETIRYVAINTGATCSTIAQSWLQDLSLLDQTYQENNITKVKLQISLPEAIVQQTAVGTSSPSTQLPTITAVLTVFDTPFEHEKIQCFLGSDILRTRNADILFSQDRLVLYDDQNNKLNVPLVRPEDSSAYEQLKTTNALVAEGWKSHVHPLPDGKPSLEVEAASPVAASGRSKPTYSRLDWSRVRQAKAESPTPSERTSPAIRNNEVDRPADEKQEHGQGLRLKTATEPRMTMASPQLSTPLSQELNENWSSWRKETASTDTQKGPTFSSVASSSGQNNSGQAKEMKVLKARRLSSNRSLSAADTSRPDSSTSIWGAISPATTSSTQDGIHTAPMDVQRRTYSSDLKSAFSGGSNGTRPSNPVGGASAFGWLNPAHAR